MKILLLGSGGREHALFWKLKESPSADIVDVFPGNGGFPDESLVSILREDQSLASLQDLDLIRDFVKRNGYDLVVVGPEQPLVDGIADRLHGIAPVFGPVRSAARLEGSKDFAKEFMLRHSIPTARARSFSRLSEAIHYLDHVEFPVVIKADGLAAGKGVTVATDRSMAEEALQDALEKGRFGESGQRVLVEDFLKGYETSVFALCDGNRAIPFVPAQDFKRALDGDRGPNTGGMGAYAPVPMVTPEIMETIQREVLDPVVRGMNEEGTPYRGLLYAGLMIDGSTVNVVEFNCRFGDPETQPLMRLLDEDLADLLYRAATGNLEDRPLRFKKESAMVVVVAAEGYPGKYRNGIDLSHLYDIDPGKTLIFHAGTEKENGSLRSKGGRILGITAGGKDIGEARALVYQTVEKITRDGLIFRKDIGERVG